MRRVLPYTFLILTCFTIAACSKSGSTSGSSAGGSGSAASGNVKLAGAGASFPFPLYDKWFADYRKLHPGVSINYQGIGSGGGITQLTNKTVDFAASDAAMTDAEIAKVEGGVVLLPMTAGSIVLAYNVPGAPENIKLSREAYVGIFLGKITKWNDEAIAKSNAGVTLPDTKITPVHRADSSGTTFVFTQHLSAISEEWKKGPGTDKTVAWPATAAIGAKKNDGIAATIKQTPGAIGYIEFGFVSQAKLSVAALENKEGAFVVAETKSAQAALASVPMPDNLIVWIPDPAGKDSYPIVTYTWLLTYTNYADADKAKTLKDVIRYGLTEGQKISEEHGYIPLPAAVTDKVAKALDKIKP
ncbi:MAG: phosphate ABC transporter substrate-binding protein PstS [Planctomycetia bacterium]|nr:phosphate ABC transporter substrate-binding protein PstS [Planctomycetia bacterium]